MLIWGQKGAIRTKLGPKWAGLDFSWTVKLNFPKEGHKISFYINKYAKLWFPAFII